jgi:prepilin-type processing-associated H-X9-DG protein
MEQAEDNITILEDGVEENKTETTIADNDSQTPEDGIAELKARLEQEKKLRLEAETRAHQATQTATKAAAEVQDSNLQLITGAIDKLKRESDYLKSHFKEAMASGDYDAAAQVQETMSLNAAKLLQLQNGKSSLEERLANPKPPQEPVNNDPVERVASTLSPRSAAWIRAHPQCITDQRMYQKMVGAHNIAMADGHVVDSDSYFDAIENQLGFRRTPQQDDSEEVNLSAAAAPTQKRTSVPAAPTTRTAAGTPSKSQVVRLSSEMREMASMMGMTPEDYAKNMVALRKEGKLQ